MHDMAAVALVREISVQTVWHHWCQFASRTQRVKHTLVETHAVIAADRDYEGHEANNGRLLILPALRAPHESCLIFRIENI